MLNILKTIVFNLFIFLSISSFAEDSNTFLIETNRGNITIEIYPERAPKTVENFKEYVKSGFYDGLIFHRIIDNFMIQGGGFDEEYDEKRNECPNY